MALMHRGPDPSELLTPRSGISEALRIVHYAYPAVLLSVFLVAFVARSILTASEPATSTRTGPNGRPLPEDSRSRALRDAERQRADFTPLQKAFFNWVSVGVIFTFLGNAGEIIAHALVQRPWWCGKAAAIYIVSSVFVYSLFLISQIDTKPAPTVAHLVTWTAGLLLETGLLAASLMLYTADQSDRGKHPRPRRRKLSRWELIELIIDGLRLVFIIALIGSYLVLKRMGHIRNRDLRRDNIEEPSETTGLLQENAILSGGANGHGANEPGIPTYGSTVQTSLPKPEPPPPPAWSRPTTAPSKSWWEYLRGYSLFFPYLWPSKSRKLQVIVVVCFVLVLLQRVINVLVPFQVEKLTDILSGENGEPPRAPWKAIFVFIGLRLLQGNSGLLGAVRSSLWIPIGQYSYQALSTSSFEHVHSLSLDFHLSKKTGEVLSALSKGNAINTFLEQVTFQVFPMLIDLCFAIGYFLIAFDAYYALVVAIVTFSYLYITVRLAQWRTEMRRKMVNAGREEDAVKNDSMVSYETIKYFNAEAYEFERYRKAVQTFQKAEYQVLFSLNVLNVAQSVVFTLGLLITCFIAAYQVTTGQSKVGRFVALLTYMSQLQGPLNFFGTFYRSIQSAMINSERMLELFREQPTVVDSPNVKPLTSCQGEIRFEDVHFSYDVRKPALVGLSFTALPGTTTALVGESGGGKSTVFRLLFRFYDVSAGRILVDDHDVRDVSIDSLRRHIGVVPQDTVLFNETLMYNLKYANPAATDEMVFDACRAASIHDRIQSFPDGYLTKVGERGLRLSGGEKQRVAIARTILKDPRIILLDEATAALDSETEQNIQGALERLREGRTMLVIAHRLSTITNADQILCLHAGQVVEAGTHEELLQLRGRYASMWKKQIRVEQAAEVARALKEEVSTSGDGSGETSENDGDGQRAEAPPRG